MAGNVVVSLAKKWESRSWGSSTRLSRAERLFGSGRWVAQGLGGRGVVDQHGYHTLEKFFQVYIVEGPFVIQPER